MRRPENTKPAANRKPLEEDLLLRVRIFRNHQDGFGMERLQPIRIGGLRSRRQPAFIRAQQVPDSAQ